MEVSLPTDVSFDSQPTRRRLKILFPREIPIHSGSQSPELPLIRRPRIGNLACISESSRMKPTFLPLPPQTRFPSIFKKYSHGGEL